MLPSNTMLTSNTCNIQNEVNMELKDVKPPKNMNLRDDN